MPIRRPNSSWIGEHPALAVGKAQQEPRHRHRMQDDNPDVSLTLKRGTLDDIMLGQSTLDDAIKSGDVTLKGDQAKLGQLVSYLDTFPFWFNIVTP